MPSPWLLTMGRHQATLQFMEMLLAHQVSHQFFLGCSAKVSYGTSWVRHLNVPKALVQAPDCSWCHFCPKNGNGGMIEPTMLYKTEKTILVNLFSHSFFFNGFSLLRFHHAAMGWLGWLRQVPEAPMPRFRAGMIADFAGPWSWKMWMTANGSKRACRNAIPVVSEAVQSNVSAFWDFSDLFSLESLFGRTRVDTFLWAKCTWQSARRVSWQRKQTVNHWTTVVESTKATSCPVIGSGNNSRNNATRRTTGRRLPWTLQTASRNHLKIHMSNMTHEAEVTKSQLLCQRWGSA